LDTTQTCHAASSLNLADGQTFAACMRDELAAKEQTAKNWTSYSATARSRCAVEATIGGSPSYADLFTCLDIARELSQGSAQAVEK
jgi:hypothetical protein